MTRLTIALAAFSLVACEVPARVQQDAPLAPVSALWQGTLHADAELALRDPARPEVRYPNPLGCHRLDVQLTAGAEISGQCERGDRDLELRGGPERGLPYLVQAEASGSTLALELLDLFGNRIARLERVASVCVEVTSSEGARCTLCSDPQGALAHKSCASQQPDPQVEELSEQEQPQDTGHGDEPTAEVLSEQDQPQDSSDVEEPTVEVLSEQDQPQDSDDTDEPTVEDLSEQEQPQDDATDQEDEQEVTPVSPVPAQASAADCYLAAVEHFVSKLDATLIAAGLPPSGLSIDDVQPSGASAELGRRTCAGELNWFESDPVYLTDAGLRCAGLGTDTAAATCDATPSSCRDQVVAYETGVGAAYSTWVQAASKPREPSLDTGDEASPSVNPELPVCTGSPLVVELEPGELALSALEDGVEFDLFGDSRPVHTGWVRGGALLGMDLDGDGRITSGRELFGEATRLPDGALAHDGFTALASHDGVAQGGNGDGRIDARDAVFERLLLWRDHDHDGVSQPDELQPLSHELDAIALTATRAPELGARSAGHDVALSASARRVDGSPATVYDVWFRYTAAPLPQS